MTDSINTKKHPAFRLAVAPINRRPFVMNKRSAFSQVKRSGYEVVKATPSKGKLATERDYAKTTWTPWKAEKDDELQPSDEALLKCGAPARFAYAVLLKTREELIAMHGVADHKHIDKLMASWAQTAEWLKSIVVMLDQASLRTIASAAAHNANGGKFPGVYDMRKKKRALRRAA